MRLQVSNTPSRCSQHFEVTGAFGLVGLVVSSVSIVVLVGDGLLRFRVFGRTLRPCAAVCAISALKVKNGFLAYFSLAAAKAKRRYPLLDPFQDSDVGKSGEYSDVAILQPKSNSLRIPPPPRWHPRRIMRSMSNSSASHVASSLHLRPSYYVLTYCQS